MLKKILSDISALHGDKLREYLISAFSRFGQVGSDALGNLFFEIPGKNGGSVLVEAHRDEVGFIVREKLDNGFYLLDTVGTLDRRILPATRILFETSSGIIPAVITADPPHIDGEADSDIKAEAAGDAAAGDRGYYAAAPFEMKGGCFAGPGLDNKASVAVLFLLADRLSKQTCGHSVTFLLSNLEEVSQGGAAAFCRNKRFKAALVFDVSFAGAQRGKCGVSGNGPMIGCSPVLSDEFRKFLIKTAEKADILYQHEIMPGKTSTDADIIAVSGGGVRTALISTPVFNMHSCYEIVNSKDIETAAELAFLSLHGDFI